MFEKLFKHNEEFSEEYFEKSSINLFTVDLVISCICLLLAILIVFTFDIHFKYSPILFYTFPFLYILSFFLFLKKRFEYAYLVYHFNSYFLILFLIILIGSDANFQFYFISICFSIYLYSTEKKTYHNYLLIIYVATFVLSSLIPFKTQLINQEIFLHFFSLANLIMTGVVIIIKSIKYVDLKERAVQRYKDICLKSREAEKQLKDRQAIFNFLFNSSIYGAEFSIDNAITNEEITYDTNNALVELLKMDKETIKNVDRLSFSPKIQSNGKNSFDYNLEIKQSVENNNQCRYEWDFINGEHQIINTEITQVRLIEDDKIINLAFIKNITNQKKIERELFESELMYRTLFENVYDGIKIDIYDKKSGKTLNQFLNQKMLALFKINEYDSEEDDYMRFIPKYQTETKSSLDLILELREEFEKNKSVNFRMNLINANDEPFTADFNAVQIEDNNIRKVILISKDVTEIVKKEQIINNQIQTLEKKKVELEKYVESNKELELFAFKASHDLKNPITTIKKFVQILKKENKQILSPVSKSYLDFIELSTTYLSSFVDDSLNHSRITRKKINIQPINPIQIIQFILKNIKSSIEETKAKIIIHTMPEYIEADEIKFIAIIQNLITNALRYRKKNILPIIEINCVENEQYYMFKIKDNGIGIKEEFQNIIFDMYESVYEYDNEHTEARQKGNGIGLATCLKLTELHKGKIWVDSVYGQGSTFCFSISKKLSSIPQNDIAMVSEK